MAKITVPVHKGEVLTVTVADLTYEGNGVVKVDNYPVFVPYVLPGEQAEIKITKVTAKFAWAAVDQKSGPR